MLHARFASTCANNTQAPRKQGLAGADLALDGLTRDCYLASLVLTFASLYHFIPVCLLSPALCFVFPPPAAPRSLSKDLDGNCEAAAKISSPRRPRHTTASVPSPATPCSCSLLALWIRLMALLPLPAHTGSRVRRSKLCPRGRGASFRLCSLPSLISSKRILKVRQCLGLMPLADAPGVLSFVLGCNNCGGGGARAAGLL